MLVGPGTCERLEGQEGEAGQAQEGLLPQYFAAGWFNASGDGQGQPRTAGKRDEKANARTGMHRPLLAGSQSCKLTVAQAAPTRRWWSGPALQDLCLFTDDFVCDLVRQRQDALQSIQQGRWHLVVLVLFLQELNDQALPLLLIRQ